MKYKPGLAVGSPEGFAGSRGRIEHSGRVDQGVEATRESGRRDDRVERFGSAVREYRVRRRQALQRRPDLDDSLLQRLHESDVDDRHATARVRPPRSDRIAVTVRSPSTRRAVSFAKASATRDGNLLNSNPVFCTGCPNGSRGTTGGGVRMLSATIERPVRRGRWRSPHRCCPPRRRARACPRMARRCDSRPSGGTRRILVQTGCRGQAGHPVLPGCDDHHARLPRLGCAGDLPTHRRLPRDTDLFHWHVGDDPQIEMARIFLQIRDIVVARGIRAAGRRDRTSRKARVLAHGVQMQAIVAPRPGPAHRRVAFQQHRRDACSLQRRAGGKACRPCSDDHDIGLRHATYSGISGRHRRQPQRGTSIDSYPAPDRRGRVPAPCDAMPVPRASQVENPRTVLPDHADDPASCLPVPRADCPAMPARCRCC